MTGKAGEVGLIALSDILPVGMNQAVYVQSEVAAVIDFTLCEPGNVVNSNPDVQDSVMWDGAQAVTAKKMTKLDWPVFTYIRVTFTDAGTIYVGTL
jgi:hypothetical protein